MKTITPKYKKYTNSEHPRKPNNAYYFLINQKEIRVCKLFFMSTLAISHKVISTVLRKSTICESGRVLEKDKRGRHGNHYRVGDDIKQSKDFNDQQKQEIENKYRTLHEEKKLSRREKETDKAHNDPNTIVTVFDLQAVLPCPVGDANSFYYVSKLNVFNFTLYDLKRHNGTCFLWHEGEAHRGANETGSCIFRYLEQIISQTDVDLNLVFYSDDYTGQNKNRFVLAIVFKVTKDNPGTLYYKTSYAQTEFKEVCMINPRKSVDFGNVQLKKCFSKKPGISEAKKKVLLSLLKNKDQKDGVPLYYSDYYRNL
nr:unnamed protein product [Callosobruchus chinensis]